MSRRDNMLDATDKSQLCGTTGCSVILSEAKDLTFTKTPAKLRSFASLRMTCGGTLGRTVMLGMLIAVLLMASSAWAAPGPFRKRLDQAHAMLRSGDVDGALAVYRDLQTDEPESKLLYYSIGCAQYERALQETALEAVEDATASFHEARGLLDKAVNAPEPVLRRNARYNRANSVAQIAKQSVAAMKYDEVVAAFEESVRLYDDFLRVYPDHEGAQQNLDHMRYLLKKMLQNPPPPPEQQQDQGEQQDDGQANQDQQADPEEQQQDEGDQGEEGQDQEQGADQQPEPTEQAAQQENQSEESSEAEPEDRQNLEAILQSLEDMDNREMYDTMDDRERIRADRNWW